MIDPGRARRALTDVVAVERLGPGMVRVVTWSDAYPVDARDTGCACPDKEYNEVPVCKHEATAILADSDDLPTPFTVTDDLSTRAVATDGGEDSDDEPADYVDEVRIDGVAPDGRPRVERKTVRHTHSSTVARHERLPPECAVLVTGDGVPVADLSPDERAWVEAHTDGDPPQPADGSVTVRDSETGDVFAADTTAAAEAAVMQAWEAEQ